MIPLGEHLDRLGRSEAGWVSINPLVLFPMLLLILLGATDFARMYYPSATLIALPKQALSMDRGPSSPPRTPEGWPPPPCVTQRLAV